VKEVFEKKEKKSETKTNMHSFSTYTQPLETNEDVCETHKLAPLQRPDMKHSFQAFDIERRENKKLRLRVHSEQLTIEDVTHMINIYKQLLEEADDASLVVMYIVGVIKPTNLIMLKNDIVERFLPLKPLIERKVVACAVHLPYKKISFILQQVLKCYPSPIPCHVAATDTECKAFLTDFQAKSSVTLRKDETVKL
jgi:hypothetical protein